MSDGDGGPLDGDVSADADADADADSDSDADSDADTDTTGPPPTFSDLSSRIHPDFGTLVYASWTQSGTSDVTVEYTIDGETWMSSPVVNLGAGEHEQLLLGIPYETDVTWHVVGTTGGGTSISDDVDTRTEDTPDSMPVGEVETAEPDAMDPSTAYIYLSLTQENGGDFGDRWWVLIIDRLGRPVWGKMSDSSRTSLHPRPSYDGTALLVDQNSYWATFNSSNGSVDKIKIDGTRVTSWQTPGLHHPLQELPDGSLAYGAFTGWYDESLTIVHPDGTSDEAWSCDDFLVDIGENESCASNTLNYDPVRNTFLYSFFTFETVVEIDATSFEALRWFGHVNDAYAFDPSNSAFWYQHGGHFTDAGTFLVSSHASSFSDELVVREYEVDEANETLHQVWSFGVGVGTEASDMGEPHRLGNGNTLHNFGTNPKLKEITPDGEVVWELDWDVYAMGRSTPLSDLYVFAP